MLRCLFMFLYMVRFRIEKMSMGKHNPSSPFFILFAISSKLAHLFCPMILTDSISRYGRLCARGSLEPSAHAKTSRCHATKRKNLAPCKHTCTGKGNESQEARLGTGGDACKRLVDDVVRCIFRDAFMIFFFENEEIIVKTTVRS